MLENTGPARRSLDKALIPRQERKDCPAVWARRGAEEKAGVSFQQEERERLGKVVNQPE